MTEKIFCLPASRDKAREFAEWDKGTKYPSCTWWHGTNNIIVPPFNSFSHFSTIRAAYNAAERKSPRSSHYLYPVHLHITNSLMITDHADDHNLVNTLNSIECALVDILTCSESLFRTRKISKLKHSINNIRNDKNINEESIAKFLYNEGYDSLTYRLKNEHPGALAVIITNPDQVRSALWADFSFEKANNEFGKKTYIECRNMDL